MDIDEKEKIFNNNNKMSFFFLMVFFWTLTINKLIRVIIPWRGV